MAEVRTAGGSMGERTNRLLRGAGTLKRRGLLAGVAALVGAGLTRLAGPERSEAAHDTGADQTVLHAEFPNTTTSTTGIEGPYALGPLLTVNNASGVYIQVIQDAIQGWSGGGTDSAGVRGTSTASTAKTYGVLGESWSSTTNASGVRGVTKDGATNGVWGENSSTSTNATGVYGLASGASGSTIGVWGRSDSTSAGAIGTYGEVLGSGVAGTGVKGFSPAGMGVNGISTSGTGVYGQVVNTTGPGTGVRGVGFQGSGMHGTATTGFGVLGQSSAGAGVFGDGTAPGGYGVFGRSTSGIGVFGTTTSGHAGYFNGNVTITGTLTLSGGAKSAAVPHPDGLHRRMYCVEATESWFEDIGRDRLVNGKAEVKLDPEFNAVVKGDNYFVFLTPHDAACKGLAVTGKRSDSFTVQELLGGTGSGTFDYRIMAKRKDIAGPRLEKVDLRKGPPQIKLPEPLGPDGHLPASARPAGAQDERRR
jgi:hypothetical protein